MTEKASALKSSAACAPRRPARRGTTGGTPRISAVFAGPASGPAPASRIARERRSAATRARCWRSTREAADLHAACASAASWHDTAITASEIAEPIRTSTSVNPRTHRVCLVNARSSSEWSAAVPRRARPFQRAARPARSARACRPGPLHAARSTSASRTSCLAAVRIRRLARFPSAPRKSTAPGTLRSRESAGVGWRPVPPAAGESRDRSVLSSECRMPAASTRHSSAANCSSFCCAAATADDCAPAAQTACLDRTINSATLVVIAMTTATAISASSRAAPAAPSRAARHSDPQRRADIADLRVQPPSRPANRQNSEEKPTCCDVPRSKVARSAHTPNRARVAESALVAPEPRGGGGSRVSDPGWAA